MTELENQGKFRYHSEIRETFLLGELWSTILLHYSGGLTPLFSGVWYGKG